MFHFKTFSFRLLKNSSKNNIYSLQLVTFRCILGYHKTIKCKFQSQVTKTIAYHTLDLVGNTNGQKIGTVVYHLLT